MGFQFSEAPEVFCIKKVFLTIHNFIEKEALTQMFSSEFFKIFKNTFYRTHAGDYFFVLQFSVDLKNSSIDILVNSHTHDNGKKKISNKQPFRGVHRKKCSENMQQIYGRTPTPKYY